MEVIIHFKDLTYVLMEIQSNILGDSDININIYLQLCLALLIKSMQSNHKKMLARPSMNRNLFQIQI